MVTDDGHGFDVGVIESPEPGHIGLPTMIERAQLAGGRCEIESEPGRGTSVERVAAARRAELGERRGLSPATPGS